METVLKSSQSFHTVSERFWWQDLIDWPALELDRSLEPSGPLGTMQVPTFFLRFMSKSVKCEEGCFSTQLSPSPIPAKIIKKHKKNYRCISLFKNIQKWNIAKHCGTPQIQLLLIVFLWFSPKDRVFLGKIPVFFFTLAEAHGLGCTGGCVVDTLADSLYKDTLIKTWINMAGL